MSERNVVILSIEERWARAIFDRQKEFEYRKQPPSLEVPFNVLLYATRGPSEIWGEVRIDDIIEDELESLLSKTISQTPHSRGEIREYFGRSRGNALHLTDISEFGKHLSRSGIEEVIPDFHPPPKFPICERRPISENKTPSESVSY